jgi:hypothetical protein
MNRKPITVDDILAADIPPRVQRALDAAMGRHKVNESGVDPEFYTTDFTDIEPRQRTPLERRLMAESVDPWITPRLSQSFEIVQHFNRLMFKVAGGFYSAGEMLNMRDLV